MRPESRRLKAPRMISCAGGHRALFSCTGSRVPRVRGRALGAAPFSGTVLVYLVLVYLVYLRVLWTRYSCTGPRVQSSCPWYTCTWYSCTSSSLVLVAEHLT